MNHEPHQHLPSTHEREFAALSYLWIFSILIAFSPHGKNAFVKHHAQQVVVLFALSCISYFLPGWLYYTELIWVFLMVLGCIEAISGNYYILPLIGSIFHGKKHIHVYQEWAYFWVKKIQDLFSPLIVSKNQVPASVPVFIAKAHSRSSEYSAKKEIIEKSPRSLWRETIEEIEIFLKDSIHHYSGEIQNHRYGFEVRLQGTPLFYFGGVDGEHFTIAYHKSIAFFPGNEVKDDWHYKYYFLPTVKKENIRAFIKLLFEESGKNPLYKEQTKTVV